MPGIYRQTTETTGMYRPFKKHLYRDQQILPSNNCATQKMLPSQVIIPPYESLGIFKNSYSVPHLKNILTSDDPTSEYELFYQYYAHARKDYGKSEEKNHHRREPPLPPIDFQTRPYTPPEKRYNSYFGTWIPRDSKTQGKQRPRSGCIYDDVHIPVEENIKVNSDRNVSHSENVRVTEFPTPKFSQMYIQDQFDGYE